MPPAPPTRPLVSPGVPSRLVCQAGPCAGQGFPLQGDQLAIGRGEEAQIFLPDTSVSRRHALLRRTALGWALSDLGSGNGTRLNGAPLLGERPLAEGDVIALGDTRLAFIAGDDAGPFWRASAPAGGGGRTRRSSGRLAAAGGALARAWRRALQRLRGAAQP